MILSIPHKSQLNQGVANLCSQACAAMLIEAYTGVSLTPFQVAQQTGTADGKFKSLYQLTQMLAHDGIPASITLSPYADLDWHEAQVRAGKPTIALVTYSKLNPAHPFDGGHFVVVRGFDATHVYICDPLQNTAGKVTRAAFNAAIRDTTINLPCQAVQLQECLPMPFTGVNINPRQFDSPAPARLTGLVYVRFPILIREYEGETAAQILNFYAPTVQMYAEAGIQSVLPLTHEIGLEGKGFNFSAMSAADWQRFNQLYLERVRVIVERFRGLRCVFQVMNEQDSVDGRASVIVPPVYYGALFNAAYALIKSIDVTATVITGGYNSGADRGVQQFRDAKITKTDGVAFHPYGASANGMYQGNDIATLQTQVQKWQALNVPLYISEWGALGLANEPVEKMTQYIRAFVDYCRGRIAAAVYFAWFAQDEHPYNSYPVVNADGTTRELIFDALTGDVPGTPPDYKYLVLTGTKSLNFRAAPNGMVIGALYHRTPIRTLSDEAQAGKYRWRKAQALIGGATWLTGWFAPEGESWLAGESL